MSSLAVFPFREAITTIADEDSMLLPLWPVLNRLIRQHRVHGCHFPHDKVQHTFSAASVLACGPLIDNETIGNPLESCPQLSAQFVVRCTINS